MCPKDSTHLTYEFKKYYLIKSDITFYANQNFRKNIYSEIGKLVKDNFEYSSDNNSEWMDSKDLKLWINDNKNTFVDI